MGELEHYQDLVATYGMAIGTKIVAAIIFWIVGCWLIGLVGRMMKQAFEKQKLDTSLIRYIGNFVAVTLNIVLVGKQFESSRIYADAEHLTIHRHCG
jgi:small conductance mechanosensitive channel